MVNASARNNYLITQVENEQDWLFQQLAKVLELNVGRNKEQIIDTVEATLKEAIKVTGPMLRKVLTGKQQLANAMSGCDGLVLLTRRRFPPSSSTRHPRRPRSDDTSPATAKGTKKRTGARAKAGKEAAALAV